MQFVQIKFRPNDARTFTYTHDGEPLAVGDKVDVETMRGEVTVPVVGVSSERPESVPFDIDLKPIVRVFSRAPRDDAPDSPDAHSPPSGQDSPDTTRTPDGGDTRST